ncbi:hypothetical protein K9L16_02855 [Candidatus Pacearchaeota archaeon]|nr:hypothetical protein [Candidatus Pacearchaeota archaeon]
MEIQLIEKVKKNLKKGYSAKTLKYALINQGYSRISVERAIERAQKEIAKELPEVTKDKPVIKYELYDSDNKQIWSSTSPNSKKKKPFWKKFLGK